MGVNLKEYLKLMEQQDWVTLRTQMLLEGPYPHGWDIDDRVQREEYVSHAIEKVYTGDHPWDATKGSIKTKLRQSLRSVISNDRTRMENSARAHDVVNEDGQKVNPIDLEADPRPTQDVELESKEKWQTVLKMNEGDEVASLVLLAYEDGYQTPREACDATGYPIETVRKALKRIRRKYYNK